VRVVGASNLSPERLTASLAASKTLDLPRYESLQPLYNLSDRKEFETEYASIIKAEGIGVINYYSLAAGFLTGKYRSHDEAGKHPGRGGRLKRYADARGFRILKAMDGAYRLAARGTGTAVTYELSVEVKMPMLGMLRRKAEKTIIDTALKELKKRAEG